MQDSLTIFSSTLGGQSYYAKAADTHKQTDDISLAVFTDNLDIFFFSIFRFFKTVILIQIVYLCTSFPYILYLHANIRSQCSHSTGLDNNNSKNKKKSPCNHPTGVTNFNWGENLIYV